jgi:hypothetical protein
MAHVNGPSSTAVGYRIVLVNGQYRLRLLYPGGKRLRLGKAISSYASKEPIQKFLQRFHPDLKEIPE